MFVVRTVLNRVLLLSRMTTSWLHKVRLRDSAVAVARTRPEPADL